MPKEVQFIEIFSIGDSTYLIPETQNYDNSYAKWFMTIMLLQVLNRKGNVEVDLCTLLYCLTPLIYTCMHNQWSDSLLIVKQNIPLSVRWADSWLWTVPMMAVCHLSPVAVT